MGELFPRREGRPRRRGRARGERPRRPGLHEASFTLRRGEVLGVFGLMGSGRTEMVRALFGLARPAAGRVSVGGRRAPPRRGARPGGSRDGLGYLSEDRKGEGLALPLSVADNVTLTRLSLLLPPGRPRPRPPARGRPPRGRTSSTCACATPARPCARSPAATSRRSRSRGSSTRRRTSSSWTSRRAASTWGARPQIYEAVARAADAGKGVLMVSSYLPELLGVCDRLAVMSRGPPRPRPARRGVDAGDRPRGGDRGMRSDVAPPARPPRPLPRPPARRRVLRARERRARALPLGQQPARRPRPDGDRGDRRDRHDARHRRRRDRPLGRLDDRAHRRPLRPRPARRLGPVARGPGRGRHRRRSSAS